jgi:putative flippase GtrA
MKQLARFILVGASGTLLQLLLMFIIVDGFSVPVLVANIISFIIVVTWNYLWNSRITFKDRQIGVVKWIKYVVGNLMGLLVQEIWFKDVSGVKFLTQDRVYNGIAGGAPIEEMLARAVKYYRSKGVL